MKCFYLDSAPDHRHLWPQLNPAFKPIPQNYSSPEDYENRIERFFAEKLAQYPGPEPILIVFHISEKKTAGGYFQICQNWVAAWAQPDLIYTVLVTGGEPARAQEMIHRESLSEEYFYAYPKSLGDIGKQWSALQTWAWKTFMQDLALHKRAFWPLLEAKRYTNQAIHQHFSELLNSSVDTPPGLIHRLLSAQTLTAGLAQAWQRGETLLNAETPVSSQNKLRLSELYFGDDQGVQPGLCALLQEKLRSV